MKKLERAPGISADIWNKYIKLSADGAVQQVLADIHEQYSYWDKVKYRATGDVSAEEIWMMTKIKRMGASSFLTFGQHTFTWNINNTIQEYLHFLDMNIGGNLESSAVISREDKNRYLVSSVMEEAIASSQIEGAVTTRRKAKEMLRRNARPTNKSEQMILNNYETIRKILDIKAEPLNTQNLLALHRLVTNNTMNDAPEEGAFRTGNDVDVIDVETGEIVHHPPDMTEMEAMLGDLYTFFNEDQKDKFVHPLIKACIIHFMIGYIHPFADGNGRTARALFYWYLLRKGYWLTEYLSISRLLLKAKTQYARAFLYTETDGHDLTYFVLFNLRTMKLSFDELRAYIQRKNNEKATLSHLLQHNGVSYKEAIILEWFEKQPSLLLTVKEAETRLAISAVAARKNLMRLVEKGLLAVIDLDKKTKAFVSARPPGGPGASATS